MSPDKPLTIPAWPQGHPPDAPAAASAPGRNAEAPPTQEPAVVVPSSVTAAGPPGDPGTTTIKPPDAGIRARPDTAVAARGTAAPEPAGGADGTPDGTGPSLEAEAAGPGTILPPLATATFSASPVEGLARRSLPGSPGHVPVVHDVRLAAVPVEIGLKSLAGVNRFEMRLDPPELGRVDVRIDIDEDGGVKTRLVVDRADTLALLRRDAPQLRHTLEQAGLKPDEGSIDLMLRDPSHQAFGESRGGRDGSERGQPEPSRSGPVKGPEQNAFVQPAPSPFRRRDGIDRTV